MASALLSALAIFGFGMDKMVGALMLKALWQYGQELPTLSSRAAPQDGQIIFGDIFFTY
jgi:hypothetical protein